MKSAVALLPNGKAATAVHHVRNANKALKYARFARRTSVATRLLRIALRSMFAQNPLRHTGRLTLR